MTGNMEQASGCGPFLDQEKKVPLCLSRVSYKRVIIFFCAKFAITSGSGQTLSRGAIAGSVIGVIVFVAIVVFILAFLCVTFVILRKGKYSPHVGYEVR